MIVFMCGSNEFMRQIYECMLRQVKSEKKETRQREKKLDIEHDRVT